MKEINVHYIYKYAEHISWGRIEDEIFVINEITGIVCILKKLQKDVWMLLDGNRSISDILSELGGEDIKRKEIEEKLYKFVKKMEEKELIVRMLENE